MTSPSVAQNEANIIPGNSDRMTTGVNALLASTVLFFAGVAGVSYAASKAFSSDKAAAPANITAPAEKPETLTYSINAKKCPAGSIKTDTALSGETIVTIPKGCLPQKR